VLQGEGPYAAPPLATFVKRNAIILMRVSGALVAKRVLRYTLACYFPWRKRHR
jgi:hypothetical protein